MPRKWKRLYNTGLCECITEDSSGLLDVDELREVLDVGEGGVLLHPKLVPGDQEAHQLLVEGLDLGQVVVLDQLQLGNVQTRKGASVELKEKKRPLVQNNWFSWLILPMFSAFSQKNFNKKILQIGGDTRNIVFEIFPNFPPKFTMS